MSHIALLDLDGTVADYENGMDVVMQRLAAPGEHIAQFYGKFDDVPAYIEHRRALIKRSPGFWLDLDPLPMGFEVVSELQKLDFLIHVLTKGPRATTSAWTEKVEWCRKHLPDAAVTVTEDKSLVYGRVLVDDYPPYFLKWLEHRPRGLVVAVAQTWNQGITHPNVLRYNGTNRTELVRRLTEQIAR